jgi:hypothetical protein
MSSSSESTTLASGVINGAGDTITVELIRPANIPAAERTLKRAVVRITWPPADTLVSPQRFPDAAAFLTRLFAAAATELAAIKARRRL